MQSQLGTAQTARSKEQRPAEDPRPRANLSGLGLACEQAVLLAPVERQIEFGQPRRGELDGLPPLQDRFDELRAQKSEIDQTPDIAPGYAVALGQFLRVIGRGRWRAPQTTRGRGRSP